MSSCWISSSTASSSYSFITLSIFIEAKKRSSVISCMREWNKSETSSQFTLYTKIMTMSNNMCKEGSNMLIYSQFTTNLTIYSPCNFGYYVIWHAGAAVWQISSLPNMIQCLTGLICVIRSLPRLNIQDFTLQHLDLLLTWLNYASMQLSDERCSFSNEICSVAPALADRAVRDCQTPTSAIPTGPHSDGSPRSSDRRAVHSSSITSWTMTEAPEPRHSSVSLSPIWRYFSSSLDRLFLSLSTHR